MSLSRTVFNEFRPFFHLFDDIARAARPSYASGYRQFDHAFDAFARHPAVDLSEEGDKYVVEAEVPGVKKENLDVRVGDGGRSVTIEGKIISRSSVQAADSTSSENGVTSSQSNSAEVVQSPEKTTAISPERELAGASYFTRTIWLPRHVNASKISGSLEDGILRLQIPKAEELDSVKIEIQ